MKLSDFLKDVGRPVAYYPGLARIIGVKECVFVCQLAYWTDRQEDPAGWIFKHHEDFTRETGLSYEEQKTARKNLKDFGILSEKVNRLKHQTAYRIDFEKLNRIWEDQVTPREANATSGSGKAHLPEGQMPSPEVAKPLSGTTTESTTETTTEKVAPALPPEAEFWNEHCGSLPKVVRVGPERMKHLKCRREDLFWVASYEAAVKKMAGLSFCNGGGERGWLATFDWLVENSENLTCVLEGKYDNRNTNGHRVGQRRTDLNQGTSNDKIPADQYKNLSGKLPNVL